MATVNVTRCESCKALMNPNWTACLVCGAEVAHPDIPELAMTLEVFEREGRAMEIKVRWHTENLWFVPTEAGTAALVKAGVSRGRIWTARELMGLLTIPGLTKERVAKVAQAKAIFEGTVTA